MKKFIFLAFMLLVTAIVVGQRGPNHCAISWDQVRILNDHGNINLRQPFPNNIINIEKAYRSDTRDYRLILEVTLTNDPRTGDDNNELRFIMGLPKGIEPMPRRDRNYTYPEGYDITYWRENEANNPAAKNFKRFERDTEYDRGDFTIATLKSQVGNRRRTMQIAFFLEYDNIYYRNLEEATRDKLRIDVFSYGRDVLGRPKLLDACNVATTSMPPHRIDLIRPSFSVIPDPITANVNEEFVFDIPANDWDMDKNKIPQDFRNNTSGQRILFEGVKIVVKSVKKIVNLEGGVIRKDTYDNNNLPRGLRLDQEALQIVGTPEEVGDYEIEMIAVDAAGNEHGGGSGNPNDYSAPVRTLILNIVEAMPMVNPGMRMRVAR